MVFGGDLEFVILPVSRGYLAVICFNSFFDGLVVHGSTRQSIRARSGSGMGMFPHSEGRSAGRIQQMRESQQRDKEAGNRAAKSRLLRTLGCRIPFFQIFARP